MGNITEKTTKEEQRVAKRSIMLLRKASTRLSKKRSSIVRIKLQEEAEFLEIPPKALSLLHDIVSLMADGKSITLIPSDSEVSTQEAAELLNVSRPHIVKLLERGEIPYKKVGSHRRILLKDLMRYDDKVKKKRAKQLDFLTKQSQVLDLGY
jgi:excisionase family DNA binding protein